MSHMYSLGAVDSVTNEYTQPADADPAKVYKCVECDQRVIPRKGNVRRHHFAHYAPTNTCTYYEHPNESQIHRDSKYKLAEWLSNSRPLEITWKCGRCNGHTGGKMEHNVKYEDGDEPVVEYRDPNGKYIADVALINNGNVRYIFEVKHTHATQTTVRPDPWFEFTTKDIQEAEKNAIETHNLCNIISEEERLQLYLDCCRNRGIVHCYWCDEHDPRKHAYFEVKGREEIARRREQDALIEAKQKEIEKRKNKLRQIVANTTWLLNVRQLCPANHNGLQHDPCLNCNELNYTPIRHIVKNRYNSRNIYRQLCEECLLNCSEQLNKKYSKTYNGQLYIGDTDKKHADYISHLDEPWLKNIPRLSHKVGDPTWKQVSPCIKCGCYGYSPVFSRGYLQICKICISDHEMDLKKEYAHPKCMIALRPKIIEMT